MNFPLLKSVCTRKTYLSIYVLFLFVFIFENLFPFLMFLSKTMFFPSKFYVVSKQKSRLSGCVCVCVRVCVCLTNKPTQQDEMYCIIQRKCWVEPRQGRNMSIGCNFCISSIVVIDACSWCTNLAHDLGMLGYVGCTNMAHPGNLVCAIYSAVPIPPFIFDVKQI